MKPVLSTLLLAGSALAVPTSTLTAAQQTCVDNSLDVGKWKVNKFDYHASYIFTNPAHQNSWGYVNFTLENDALDYKPVCSASSDQLDVFFYGTLNYNCTLPDGVAFDDAKFNFSYPSGLLAINQSWACKDEGADFMAMGGVTLDLHCDDKKWENPDWEEGQIYSSETVTCNKVDADAPMTTKTAVA